MWESPTTKPVIFHKLNKKNYKNEKAAKKKIVLHCIFLLEKLLKMNDNKKCMCFSFYSRKTSKNSLFCGKLTQIGKKGFLLNSLKKFNHV